MQRRAASRPQCSPRRSASGHLAWREPVRTAIPIWLLLLGLIAANATLLRAASFRDHHAMVMSMVDQAAGQDYQKLKEEYEKGAVAGNATAMADLGYLYDRGQGVPQDYRKAREWYEKAAAARNATAMNNLAFLYYQGHGVPQNYQKARE